MAVDGEEERLLGQRELSELVDLGVGDAHVGERRERDRRQQSPHGTDGARPIGGAVSRLSERIRISLREKKIAYSGIAARACNRTSCSGLRDFFVALSLMPGCLSCADDPNQLRVIGVGISVNHEQQHNTAHHAEQVPPFLPILETDRNAPRGPDPRRPVGRLGR